MLVDMFSRRYEGHQLRDGIEQRDTRLLMQAFRILADDLRPYYRDGKEDALNVAFWTSLHNDIAREYGLKSLSPRMFSYVSKLYGVDQVQTTTFALVTVCENWLTVENRTVPDIYIKNRLSLIELGFRRVGEEISRLDIDPIVKRSRRTSLRRAALGFSDLSDVVHQIRRRKEEEFRAAVDELNARFRQARYPLHYHNGFLQLITDELVQQQVEEPFWNLVSDAEWKNVDLDMKEALDLRDSDGKDPAFYAARSLESAIKIISDKKKWTSGRERGASNYIDNLAKKSNAYITPWEADSLRAFFTNVRNPFGHGPGGGDMPKLTRHQTEWSIEFSMIWIKNLLRRL